MKAQRGASRHRLSLLLAAGGAAAALAGCGERAPANQSGSTTPRYDQSTKSGELLGEAVTPVRIGELGPSFPACTGRGLVRTRTVAGPIPVRAAPFDQAEQIDSLPVDGRFFLCSRSHDQRWFGIVYDEGGTTSDRCAVTSPVPQRRDYGGPCAAGWVSSAQVRLVSGQQEAAGAADSGDDSGPGASGAASARPSGERPTD